MKQTISFLQKKYEFRAVKYIRSPFKPKPDTFMKQLLYIGVLHLLLASACFAQTKTQLKIIDSLKTRISQPTLPDTVKVDHLNELAWLHRNFDNNAIFSYAKQAEALAKKVNYKSGLATAYNRLATAYKSRDEYEKVINYYRQALDIEEDLQHNYGISRAYNNLGIVLKKQRKYQNALGYFQKSLTYLRKSKKYSQAKVGVKKLNIANCYKSMGEAQLAVQNYLDAINAFKEDKKQIYSKPLGNCYLGLGLLYKKTNHFEKSRVYALKALAIFEKRGNRRLLIKTYNQLGILHYEVRDYERALQYYYQNLRLRDELGSTQNIQGVYNNLGLVYLDLQKLDSAQYFIKKSIELSIKKNDSQTLTQAYNDQGLILVQQKKYKEAVDYFTKALQLANKTENRSSRKKSLEYLSNAYAKMEQYDNAFKYFDDYKDARDSLETNFRKAMDYKDNYEKEKHQRELLEKDQKIKNAELARLKEYSFRQTLANYFFGVGLLLSLIIVFAIIKNYQERRKVRQKQQRIDKLLNDQEFLALSKMLEGQEKERERVAQDLHDRLGGMLSVLQYQFTTLNNVIDWGKPEDKEVYSKALTLLDETCDSVRKVSHNIASKALKEFGLIPALNDLKVQIEATKHLTVEITDVGFAQRLPAKYEAQVYRIVQELLGNVLKHANAQEVGVQLYWKHEEANLHISVEDDGRGFDVAQAQAKRGIGLAGLKSRVKSLVGTYSIDSSLGKGTTVMIDIPVLITPNEIEETKQLKQ